MKDQLFMKLTIKDGKLHFPKKGLKTRLDKFISSLPDDCNIELFIGASTSKGSLPQKAKLQLQASIKKFKKVSIKTEKSKSFVFFELKDKGKIKVILEVIKNKEKE